MSLRYYSNKTRVMKSNWKEIITIIMEINALYSNRFIGNIHFYFVPRCDVEISNTEVEKFHGNNDDEYFWSGRCHR